MVKKKFDVPEIEDKEVNELKEELEKIYNSLKSKFKKYPDFQGIILSGYSYQSDQVMKDQTPEELVSEAIVEPVLKYLGYTLVGQTKVKSPFGYRIPDYTINSLNEELTLYVEVEPMNTDLFSKGKGVSQVEEWLLSRASKTDMGIATDGILWLLVRFNDSTWKADTVLSVDLRPFFSFKLGSSLQPEIDKEALRNLLLFKPENLNKYLNNYLVNVEENKEEITQKFYDDYIGSVFGLDRKGNTLGGKSLLNSVVVPENSSATTKGLFSVLTLNRLLFITFLEDQGIVPRHLINSLNSKFKESASPQSFYSMYIKPLFYDVFNKNVKDRNPNIRQLEPYNLIPYLNGSLFRKSMEAEEEYDIEDEGMQLVIENLLEKYNFGVGQDKGSELKPEILGYIFEKTINYISGTGTNTQKLTGAYYTPDDVVSFITRETLEKTVLEKMIDGLKATGWVKRDIAGYNNVGDVLNNIPKNPIHIREMLKQIESIKILDPACGSGHFLVNAANFLARIEASLYLALGEDPDLFAIRKKVVSESIFGVDIDEISVEITKLRLWLSVVSQVKDENHIETLPNIEFNILAGNSLIGQQRENLVLAIDRLVGNYIDARTEELLRNAVGDETERVMTLLKSNRVDGLSRAYQHLLQIYKSRSGEQVSFIHDTLNKIKADIYNSYDSAFVSYIVDRTMTPQERKRRAVQERKDRSGKAILANKPFHWSFDFAPVLNSGGFDVIIGNPPYIEDRDYSEQDLTIIRSQTKGERNGKKNRMGNGKTPLFYQTWKCGNVYAYFIERSINLLNLAGRFGFIVPLALVSTDRMAPLRKLLISNSDSVAYYNFDYRPGKLFSGLEDPRSTIVLTKKGKGTDTVTTSKYHRWYAESRPSLFDDLKSVKYKVVDRREVIPKLGSEVELTILRKMGELSGGNCLSNVLGGKEKVWYYNTPQYWIHAHTDGNVPMVEYYSDYSVDKGGKVRLGNRTKAKITDQYKYVETDEHYAPILVAILNSSLFYWWYVILSDGRHLLAQHIDRFPMYSLTVDGRTIDQLSKIVSDLMKDYNRNSDEKVHRRRGGYAIKVCEIIPRKSREILSQIDEIVLELYRLNEEEKDFIKTFDLDFRTRNENE